MIENVPTADELLTVSLRLYFKAWRDVTDVVTEWEQMRGGPPPLIPYGTKPVDTDGNQSEWEEYLDDAQSDLQAAYTLIQQSQEIGLKARICEVSPFLLLKRTDVKPNDSQTNTWDFTDFPTLDASELIRVHNIFCSKAITSVFRELYDRFRRDRNKISHLGVYRSIIEPSDLIEAMQIHYEELYPERRWMADRLHFASLHRWAAYNDSDFNERTGLFNELWLLRDYLSDEQFRRLFHTDPGGERFICHECVTDANLGASEPYPSDVRTALRTGDFTVHCVVCDKSYPVMHGPCPASKCRCNLLSAEKESLGACMECGSTKDDVRRRNEYMPPTSWTPK